MASKPIELQVNIELQQGENLISLAEQPRTAQDYSSMQINETFSIATPSVTNHVLPISDNSNDPSFLQPLSSYQQHPHNEVTPTPANATAHNEANLNFSNLSEHQCNLDQFNNHHNKHLKDQQAKLASSMTGSDSAQTSSSDCSDVAEGVKTTPGGELNQTLPPTDMTDIQTQADGSKMTTGKKRNKASKKNAKLDPKSKLEKSRQSARECRARKKLRYQYLEDLVCNREKAVIKLREELSMFGDLSKQMDLGSISEDNRRLLVDQIKENTKT